MAVDKEKDEQSKFEHAVHEAVDEAMAGLPELALRLNEITDTDLEQYLRHASALLLVIGDGERAGMFTQASFEKEPGGVSVYAALDHMVGAAKNANTSVVSLGLGMRKDREKIAQLVMENAMLKAALGRPA